MNDFTKEELKSIYLDMNYNILKAGKNNVDQFYLKLRDKVEAMINNFCEHEIEDDEHLERKMIHREITNQQSEELKEIK